MRSADEESRYQTEWRSPFEVPAREAGAFHVKLRSKPAVPPIVREDVQPGGAEQRESARARKRAKRTHILSVANQKGGVGKTTTAISLAASVAKLGYRVLLVDLDPQGNATSGVGVRGLDRATVYDVLIDETDLLDVIEPTSIRNLFLVPANIHLAGAEIELVSTFSREQRLRKALDSVKGDFDLVIVDCPPTLGLLTVNALTASDGVIVPIQCEYYALEGLGALQRNVALIRDQLNPGLEVVGYLLTMLDMRTRLSQQVVDEMTAHFGDLVFKTRIPRSVRLAEAPGFGQPITVFDPSSRAALAYLRLARELLERLGLPPEKA